MIKLVVFSAFLAVISCRPEWHGSGGNINDVVQMIKNEGYPVKSYTVETEDGYLLDLVRIPRGIRGRGGYGYSNSNVNSNSNSNSYNYNYKKSNNQFDSNESSGSSSSSSSSGSNEENMNRPVVLLMHNFLASCEDFVIGGPTQGLAYYLADNGYDVFLGNARGSVYGRKHSVLNPDKDGAFWKFCWHEIGIKDLPAIIDRIQKETSQEKINYVGHMQGSTAFYVLTSEMPEYNDKIRAMISLGPVAFMGHTSNHLLKLISKERKSRGWVMKNLGEHELNLSQELVNTEASHCSNVQKKNSEICSNSFFLLNGYNSEYLNKTILDSVLRRLPQGASTRQILHYAQLVENGRFTKYRQELSSQHGHEGDEDYHLNKITTPVALFYTPHDTISEMEDVEMLRRKLQNVKQFVRVEELTNNVDLVYGKNLNMVYENVVKIMKNIGGGGHY